MPMQSDPIGNYNKLVHADLQQIGQLEKEEKVNQQHILQVRLSAMPSLRYRELLTRRLCRSSCNKMWRDMERNAHRLCWGPTLRLGPTHQVLRFHQRL